MRLFTLDKKFICYIFRFHLAVRSYNSNLFSCASWPFVCFLQENVHFELWPVFLCVWLDFCCCCLIFICMCLYVLEMDSLWVSSFSKIVISHSESCLFPSGFPSCSNAFQVNSVSVYVRFSLQYSKRWIHKNLLWFTSKHVLPVFPSSISQYPSRCLDIYTIWSLF